MHGRAIDTIGESYEADIKDGIWGMDILMEKEVTEKVKVTYFAQTETDVQVEIKWRE